MSECHRSAVEAPEMDRERLSGANPKIRHDRSGEHYARVERERIAGEDYLDALVRIAIEDAVRAGGNQTIAARILQTNTGRVCRHLMKARERRVNADAGRSDLNRHPSPGHAGRRSRQVRLGLATARGTNG